MAVHRVWDGRRASDSTEALPELQLRERGLRPWRERHGAAGGSGVVRVSEQSADRTYREVVAQFEMPHRGRAREVIVEYGDGTRRREIEVGKDGEYTPMFEAIQDE